MKNPRACGMLWLLAAIIAAAPLHSQSTAANPVGATPTIKVETRLVLVDVVVTDHKGQAVSSLHQQDFRILENGKPQTISAFDEHKRNASAPLNLPALPPNVYSNQQAVKSGNSVNVLLINMLNTYP